MDNASKLAAQAADTIAEKLAQAIESRGRASLMVSGGSSPKPVYARLSQADIDWSCVTIGLVDERWVEPNQDGSNETFIKANLLQNAAATANFIGMKTDHPSAKDAVVALTKRFEDCPVPFDVCVMGMGLDGHTASWFPQSSGLSAALDQSGTDLFCAVDASGCGGAGLHPQRMSLTLTAVLSARNILLFIPGDAKRNLYVSGNSKTIMDMPVNALRLAGPKLSVFMSDA